jgi:histidyl-tRNA synthetase
VLGILLEEKGKLPASAAALDFFVIDGEDGAFPKVLEVVGALRAGGWSADLNYARQSLRKQLKNANRRGARRAVIVRADSVGVKDMGTGKQVDRPLEEFLKRPTG